jgi:hypothetical protein
MRYAPRAIIMRPQFFGSALATEAGLTDCDRSVVVDPFHQSLTWEGLWDAMAASTILASLFTIITGVSNLLMAHAIR